MAARSPTRFQVVVTSRDADERPTRQVISNHGQQSPAMIRTTEIIKQWAAAQGAIRPGTTVLVVDLIDGGTLFSATYLGHEPHDLLSGR